MANKMLIDATHPEETRVVVVRGNRVEEFDFESAQRKQLRGNIYLAKVTRVEPSLQAAFVEYGGNRHGFLAFSEIHPDYYQIPVADRQALLEEDARAHRDAEEETENRSNRRRSRHRDRGARRRTEKVRSEVVDIRTDEASAEHNGSFDGENGSHDNSDHNNGDFGGETIETPAFLPHASHDDGDAAHDHAQASNAAHASTPIPENAFVEPGDFATAEIAASGPIPPVASAFDHEEAAQPSETSSRASTHDDDASSEARDDDRDDDNGDDEARHAGAESYAETGRQNDRDENGDENGDDEDEDDGDDEAEEEHIESVGGADALEEVPERNHRPRRNYKIQEVIKRRQVMLVQVVKEERGNKGAALTTYLSLAGRYSVLMPNTARGGGISRKITSTQDRHRLKDVVQDLDVPEGMGIILRTAGASRTKTEIKRDFEYLLRMWENVRDLTLRSQAPTLVYEEGSLIKRSIRDLYNKDIDEVTVAGEAAFVEARDFMRMLMPSHARNVKPYRDPQPLFSRNGIESHLDGMFQPTVQLRSGGYIVINQTEALVAIDVNSGRATREHHIEDTALKTNLEAAEEVARQLRLRDLAGLIVIDFIDMDEKRNNRAVERKLSDCLKQDRARIQVGRISHFGLLEMSRQRIRASVLESSTESCPHCGGSGHVRSVSSMALQLLRSLEETLLKGATHNLIVRTRTEVALYVLNHKRAHLRMLEERFKVILAVNADATMAGHQSFIVDRGEQVHTLEAAKALLAAQASIVPETDAFDDDFADEDFDADEVESTGEAETATSRDESGEDADARRKRRRRRRGGRRGDNGAPERGSEDAAEGENNGENLSALSLDDVEDDVLGSATETDDEGNEDSAARSESERRRRRRGRRGGRRRRGTESGAQDASGEGGSADGAFDGDDGEIETAHADDVAAPLDAPFPARAVENREAMPRDNDDGEPDTARKPSPAPRHVAEAAAALDDTTANATSIAADAANQDTSESGVKKRSTIREKVNFLLGESGFSSQPAAPDAEAVTPAPAASAPDEPAASSEPAQSDPNAPRKSGWWSRK